MVIINRKRSVAILGIILGIIVIAFLIKGTVAAVVPTVGDGGDRVEVPIIMYHSILKDPGRTGVYVITPQQLEDDLRYLKENGYQSVVMQDLIDYVNLGTPLPEKPVVLTFDDGHLNNMAYAAPLLEAYGMPAVLSVVGTYCDEAAANKEYHISYSYLSWDQVAYLSEKGVFEIQNHSYEMHQLHGKRQGAQQMAGEIVEEYRTALTWDLGRMQEKLTAHTGIVPTTFTYPFGFHSKSSREILKSMGFQATLTCVEGINHIQQGDIDGLFGLKRILRSGNDTKSTVMQQFN